MIGLAKTVDMLRLFADATRVRLAHLLDGNELSVAEMTQITELPQSRVSTHLGKLREAGVLRDRREGASTFYAHERSHHAGAGTTPVELWSRETGTSRFCAPIARAARRCCARARKAGKLARIGGRPDGSSLLARSDLGGDHVGIPALHSSGRRAGRRLGRRHHRGGAGPALPKRDLPRPKREGAAGRPATTVRACATWPSRPGDLHALPFPDGRFDHVLLLNVLTYTKEPVSVLREAARVLRPAAISPSAPWPATTTSRSRRPTVT